MKVYQVYTTDQWESYDSRKNVGIASTVEEARVFAKNAWGNIDTECNLIIEECSVGKVNGYSKFEIYNFEDGLTWKCDDSDAEYGSLEMVVLYSFYYEGYYRVERNIIASIIEAYLEYMEKIKAEPEIGNISVDEFLELDVDIRDHVLYHAEMTNREDLKDLYSLLNR